MRRALMGALLAGASAMLMSHAAVAAPATETWTPPADPYLWLEDVNGDRS